MLANDVQAEPAILDRHTSSRALLLLKSFILRGNDYSKQRPLVYEDMIHHPSVYEHTIHLGTAHKQSFKSLLFTVEETHRRTYLLQLQLRYIRRRFMLRTARIQSFNFMAVHRYPFHCRRKPLVAASYSGIQ
ncbi:hypothetical protein EVAR_15100_1 [Eumeta japonica]|uniref:Uncharacterized protein n=1 Tax=Eumeta variegata TaxID=151549 RepID=A0A4C1UI49_EUMVA|nr:hypothetical protein EVAR_15100_1 [Eumeta japonica]